MIRWRSLDQQNNSSPANGAMDLLLETELLRVVKLEALWLKAVQPEVARLEAVALGVEEAHEEATWEIIELLVFHRAQI